MQFRHDINALRALAVTAVVLFHYKVDFVPGGFVGVDIFFVISGYLMTSIITGKLAKSNFSIWDFYYDRAKRIVPGLLGMCFILLAAGYVLLEPATYHYLGSTSIAALLFFSNFRFWEATGYFDPSSDTKWLLHTWSLSVEWQFYLLYPVLLIGLYKFERTRRSLVPILGLLAFLSVLLCIWYSLEIPIPFFDLKPQKVSAFYLLPQRAWELLAGGIVALQFRNNQQKNSRILLASGFLFIALSVFFYDKNTPWPSYWALLPVIGTCLVIAANRADALPFKNKILQTIGTWSYSTYLWHWPIAVAAVYFDFNRTTPLKIAAEIVILAAILTSAGLLLSWAKRVSNETLAAGRLPKLLTGATALALTVSFAIAVTINDGFVNRWPEDQTKFADYDMAIKDWAYPAECDGMDALGNLRPCQLGLASDHGVLFLGDSYAQQFFGRFVENAKLNPENSFTFLTSAGCPPIPGLQVVHDTLHCNGFIDKALQFVGASHFKRIVLVSNWYDYFNPWDGKICFIEGDSCIDTRDPARYFNYLDAAFASLRVRLLEFKNSGAEIVIVGATPRSEWDIPVEFEKRKFLRIDTQNIETIDQDAFEKFAAPIKSRVIALAASIGAKFIDPLDFLCEDHRCPTVDESGVPYYRDKGHFRSGVVTRARFQFLDEAAGLKRRLSEAASPAVSIP